MKMKCKVCKEKWTDKSSYETRICACANVTCPNKSIAKLIVDRRATQMEIEVPDPISEYIDLS